MKEVILVNSCSFLGLMHGIAWHGEKAPALLSQNNLLQHHTLAKRLCDKQAFNFVLQHFQLIICNLTKLCVNDYAKSSALNKAAKRSVSVEEKALMGS